MRFSASASLALGIVASASAANVSTTKPGLGWGAGQADVSQFLQAGTISWYYLWTENDWVHHDNLEFVPMLWGEKDVEGWVQTINNTLETSNVTHILGFNEPNLEAQSNLTPEHAAELWKAYIQPLKASHNLTLVSPVPTNAPSGPVWLQNFTAACGLDCTIDKIALHYYGTNASQLIEYVEEVYAMFQKPIWMTEFACQSFVRSDDVATAEQISAFMNQSVDFFESTPYVERYAWFGVKQELPGMNPLNRLVDDEGHINYLGLQYIGEGTWTTSTNSSDNSTASGTSTTNGSNDSNTPTFVPNPNASGVSTQTDDKGAWDSARASAQGSLLGLLWFVVGAVMILFL